MGKNIRFIGYACGAGAGDARCSHGPDVIKSAKIERRLPNAEWAEIYNSPLEREDASVQERQAIVMDYCQGLAAQTHAVLNEGMFPVTLGGDHSMAVGTWSGVTQALDAAKSFGLIWLDAHMDAHTPATTPSGNVHGMPVATLLGVGDDGMLRIGGLGAKIDPKHMVIIGVRSYESPEQAFLESLGVRVFYMNDVHKEGFAEIFAYARKIASSGTKGYGVSIDIDGFDPAIAPGTGTTAKGGLQRGPVLHALASVAVDPKFKALEIAEFNPQKDQENMTLTLIEDIIKAACVS